MLRNISKIVALTIAFMAFFTSAAWAHSQVVSQNPEPSSTITRLPSQLLIEFNENLLDLGQGNNLQMFDPEGKEVTTGEISISNATLSRSLLESDLPGEYLVSYRAVSSDGHVIEDEYTFNLASESTSIQPTPMTTSTSVEKNSSNTGTYLGAILFLLLLCAFVIWRFRVRNKRITS